MVNVADTDDHVMHYEAIQDATKIQQQKIDVDINVAYAVVVPQNEVQESQQQGKQLDTAAPKISATNFQFQAYDNPITERNIAYGAVIPQKEAQEKQQNEQLGTAPQTTTLATNNQFPDYDYPTTKQLTREAVYVNPNFQETPKSADLPAVSAVSTAVVDDPSPYYI